MTRRFARGELSPGEFGLRISRPGFDAITEPFGSAGISFDTRLANVGAVIAAGIGTVGGSPILFPQTLTYVPIVGIYLLSAGALVFQELAHIDNSESAAGHVWKPVVALVTNSSLQLIAYTNSFWNTLSFYNPTGQSFAYFVFASG